MSGNSAVCCEEIQQHPNALLQRPTVASIIMGAWNEEQLRQNLGAAGC
jgi:aryl-alcohol dehydrogenase-like predicted oxidoreductase